LPELFLDRLAREAIQAGAAAECAFNAMNEVAVQPFLIVGFGF
jgi:1-deoxy-D-xylulose 5-phosphate reductoisomerase